MKFTIEIKKEDWDKWCKHIWDAQVKGYFKEPFDTDESAEIGKISVEHIVAFHEFNQKKKCIECGSTDQVGKTPKGEYMCQKCYYKDWTIKDMNNSF